MKRFFPRLMLCCVALASADCGGCRKSSPPAAESAKPEPTKPESEEEEAHEEIPDEVTLTASAIAEAGITTWKVQPVDLARRLVLTGSVGHDENRLLQVAANVRGRVTAIRVDLGARVRKGTPMLVIESVDLGRAREEFLKELSSYHVAARGYERAKRLVEAKAISSGEFQSREGEYLSRKAAVQAAERALRLHGDTEAVIARLRKAVEADGTASAAESPHLVLVAPFDGRVIERKVTPGSLVEALQPLLTIADLSSVWVFLQAHDKDLQSLKEGLPVVIRAEAYPQDAFAGRIDFLGSVVDAATRSVKVRATVRNPGEKLRPGMFVKAQVEIPRRQSETREVVAVPASAVQTLEGRPVVFVLTEPGVFARRRVEPGPTFDGLTEILGGLKEGEEIVTEGSFVLKSEFAKAMLKDED
jgi:cobalt-zinc-cadmium efflux system membrane fusion protein